MERVVFDLEPAGELTQRLTSTAVALEERGRRVARLLRDVDREPAGVLRLVDSAVAWSRTTSADLQWRLDYLAQCQVGLPNPQTTTLPDGRTESYLPFDSRQEADRWLKGSLLHGQLLAAFDDVDDAAVRFEVDRLAAMASDPLVLAGFASMLGSDGLAGLVDRIDRARDLDPTDSWQEFWNGAVNHKWDGVHQALADVAVASGGLLTYDPDRPVEVLTPSGIVIVSMRDLLTVDADRLSGLWTQGLALPQDQFVDLGGLIVRLPSQGLVATSSGILVAGESGLDRALTHPIAELPGIADGLEDGLFDERPNGGRYDSHFVMDRDLRNLRPDLKVSDWHLPVSGSRFARGLGQVGKIDTVFDVINVGGDMAAAWNQGDGAGRLVAATVAGLDGGTRVVLEGVFAGAGATLGAAACAPLGPGAVVCGAAGALAGDKVGGKVHDLGKGVLGWGGHVISKVSWPW